VPNEGGHDGVLSSQSPVQNLHPIEEVSLSQLVVAHLFEETADVSRAVSAEERRDVNAFGAPGLLAVETRERAAKEFEPLLASSRTVGSDDQVGMFVLESLDVGALRRKVQEESRCELVV